MAAIKAYIASQIFTGEQWLHEHAAIVVEGAIKEVLPVAAIDSTIEIVVFKNSILAPAFIDLQIYGAHEKLFSIYQNTESLQLLNSYCNRGGAAFCMPTVATNKPEVFYNCIDAIRQYWQQGGEGILGLHAEGPWINKLKRGAHIEAFIHSPSLQEVRDLLAYGKDVLKIITLAPEVCSREVIACIHAAGVKIFAGHSDATYEEAMQSFDNGIAAVTHLYNAMSPLQHRSPGLVGATLDHPQIMASIIPDGFHVDYAAIRIAKKVIQERLFVITDAVTSTSEGYYQHEPDGDKYVVDKILSGSALTMYKALQNLVQHAGIETGEALRMCSLYPARAMQMDDQVGMIASGYKAKMVVLPELLDNSVVEMIL